MSSSSAIVLEERRFDVLLLGTSLTNTILAAALAKSGKKVLHLDANDYYGSADSSLTLADYHQHLAAHASTPPAAPQPTAEQLQQWRAALDDLEGGERCTFTPLAYAPPFHSFSSFTPPPPPPPQPERPASSSDDAVAPPPTTSPEASTTPAPPSQLTSPAPSSPPSPPPSLLSQSRHFSIDLTPALVLSRSSLVELMVLSNVSGYVDFKAVDSTYLYPSQQEGALRTPVSRADVFTSDLIGVNEKRQLMRLLQSVAPNHKVGAAQEERDRRELEEWSERPFADFLASRNLSPRLTAFVAYAIALLDYQQTAFPSSSSTSSSSSSSSSVPSAAASSSRITTREGVSRMRSHFLSIGRYGVGAFLYPIYALGELPQAFARLCAVHGGVFILRFPPLALVANLGERRVRGLITQAGQFIEADAVVSDWEYVRGGGGEEGGEGELVSSAVCVMDGPLIDGKGERMEQLVQCVFPPHTCGNANVVRLLQLGDAVRAAPAGLCVLHLHTLATGSARDDLQAVIDYVSSASPSWAPAAQHRPTLLHATFHQRRVRPSIFPISASFPTPPSSSSSPSSLTSGAYANLLVTSDSSPLQPLDAHVDEAAAMLRLLWPELELMAAMTATRAGADEEMKEELEELNILNSVIGVEERKEESGEVTEQLPPIIEQEAAHAPAEQKAAPAALDERAILDSLDDLTFD